MTDLTRWEKALETLRRDLDLHRLNTIQVGTLVVFVVVVVVAVVVVAVAVVVAVVVVVALLMLTLLRLATCYFFSTFGPSCIFVFVSIQI